MASLDEILKDTLLGKAAPEWTYGYKDFPFTKGIHEPDTDTSVSPTALGLSFDSLVLDEGEGVIREVQGNPIWWFNNPEFATGDSGGRIVRIRPKAEGSAGVTCRVRSMNYMTMPVLKSIEWGPVWIRSKKMTIDMELPLTQEYMIRCRYIPNGSIPASAPGFWKLHTGLDQSFELVFGYEIPLPASAKVPRKLKGERLGVPDLMTSSEALVSPAGPVSQHYNVLRLPSLRVIVVVTLACCKERNDFDPGGAFGAGRIYPLIMAMSNLSLDSLTGSVKLTRPDQEVMTVMDGEQMSSTFHSAFFTDNNEPPLGPAPIWSNLFNYYLIDPPPGMYTMVTPSLKGKEREFPDAVTVNQRAVPSFRRKVVKLPGQGEFDNLHLAPRMVVPEVLRRLNPNLTGMDNVAMAPFCVHDCFHIHWRWGSGARGDPTQVRGWVGDDAPNAKGGAPLVPGNQAVQVEMLSNTSCVYTATAEDVHAGRWQIIMHHGAAYSLAVGTLPYLAREAAFNFAGGLSQARWGWALFYWTLRYTVTVFGSAVERLTWDPAMFAKLRELPAVASKEASGGW